MKWKEGTTPCICAWPWLQNCGRGWCGLCMCVARGCAKLMSAGQAVSSQRRHVDMQEDGQAGLQELGGNATLLFYQTPEGNEGRRAYLEKRPPDFSKFPRFP